MNGRAAFGRVDVDITDRVGVLVPPMRKEVSKNSVQNSGRVHTSQEWVGWKPLEKFGGGL